MKTIIIGVLCFCFSRAVCQIKNVFCEYHIISIVDKKDTIKLQFPQIINLKQLGTTEIIPILTNSQNIYGIKLELLKSKVGLEDDLILGKCFYIKEGDAWKEIYKSAALQQDIIKANPSNLKTEHNWMRGSEGYGDFFNFTYMQLIYSY